MPTPENKDQLLPHEVTIEIDGQSVACELELGNETPANGLHITVNDISNKDQIVSAIQDAIKRKFWFTNEKHAKEQIHERFRVTFGEHATEIFNFGRELTPVERKTVASTLEKVYGAMIDKSLWNLESIQIVTNEPHNELNNQPLRAEAVPTQKRLIIYPSGLSQSAYRNGELPCTELEAVLAHEVAHVVLEDELENAWKQDLASLGWMTTTEYIIELPGGKKVQYYNARPKECPTSYAAFEPEEDRAESVVAFLFAPSKLDRKRTVLVASVLNELSDVPATAIEILPTELPKLPSSFSVSVTEQKKGLFGKATNLVHTGKHKALPIISLEKFLKLKHP